MTYEHPFGPPEEDEPAFDWLVFAGLMVWLAFYGILGFAGIWLLRWAIGRLVG